MSKYISMARLIDVDELLKQSPDVCEDAPYTGCFYGYSRELIEEMPTIDAPHWISVKERLPETDDFVIVAVLDERGDTPYQYTDFGWCLDAASCWIVNAEQRRDITHWMPLPEPPKEVV